MKGKDDYMFDKIKYNNEFNQKNYERIDLRVKKGKKEIIKKAADEQKTSINTYINDLIDKNLEKI
jgi:uncharacterized protein (DUF1778 family)